MAVRANFRSRFRTLRKNLALLRRGGLVDAVFFDDAAYRAQHPDVARVVDAGRLQSCYEHYVRWGKWERRPFLVRRSVLGQSASERVCQFGETVESQVRTWASAVKPWDVAHRLELLQDEASSGGPAAGGPAAGRMLPRDATWRAQLPRWARRPGWYMLEVTADTQPGGMAFALHPLGADGQPRGQAVALHCHAARVAKRILLLPEGVFALEVEALERRFAGYTRSLRLKPLRPAFAQSRMLRRLVRHHPRFRRKTESEALEELQPGVDTSGSSLLKLLYQSYDSTFPVALKRPGYLHWLHRVEAPQLAALDQVVRARLQSLSYRPLISVLVPTYETDEPILRACLDSVLEQSYPDWQLCVVDDASASPHVRQVLQEYAARDPRVRFLVLSERGHVCRASSAALQMAEGQFVALLDHDDLLAQHALLQVVEALQQHPEAALLYSDEDKLDADGHRCEPHFKPHYSPDLLLGINYIGHLLVARTERVRQVGGFRVGREGAQDHDLLLRLTHTLTPEETVHIPRVLYHWRRSAESTAASAEAKPYTAEAGLAAVRDWLTESAPGARAEHAQVANCYRVIWPLPEPAPPVSLLIPTRDAFELLKNCLGSLLQKTDYPNYEVVVIDNGSRRRETLQYLAQLQQDPRVRVLRHDRPFNYSELNNLGARHAQGEVLALLNDDIEVVQPDWLKEMVSQAVREKIGCVGAMLHYPDGSIQHAGVVLGIGGIAGHAYKYEPGNSLGYFSRLQMAHEVSAVTAACLVVERSIYQQAGGFDEENLKVAFNDVDFCLKVRQLGYRNLLTPYAVLLHHESATRGPDDDPERRARFASETAVMRERWGELLEADPCYSPHLTLSGHDFSLRLPE